ncbi:MAG: ABC transporter permease [Actinomycetota bacterium]
MARFVARRFLYSIPVLLGILFVTFLLARVIPGDPCRAVLGERATDQICDAFMERKGLNKPFHVQFGIYVRDVFTGDLGESFRYGRPVTTMLVERLPVTIELSMAALTVAVLLGVPLGIISGYKHNSAADVATMVGANVGVSMPVFWLGLMLQYLFAVLLRDTFLSLPPSGSLDAGLIPAPFYQSWGLPPWGIFEFVSNMNVFNALLSANWTAFRSAAGHLILPAIALGTIPMAVIARMTRSSLLDVLSLDYVRTARAKGLPEKRVVVRHALRNAMLPVVTVIGLSLGTLLGGAILTETIFGLSGVGKSLFDAIQSRDYAVVQGFTLVVAVGFVLVNMVVDLLYTYLNPKVRIT